MKPGLGLWEHVDQLQAVVEDENLSNLLLVGHSYGGALVHGLEGRIGDRLRAVVHLEGAIPEPGSSIMNMWPEARRRATLDAVAANGNGWRVPPPDPRDWGGLSDEADRLAHAETHAAVDQDLSGQNAGRISKAPNCPHYYLYASDRDPQPYAAVIERFSKARRWQLAATKGGHELMITNPGSHARPDRDRQ